MDDRTIENVAELALAVDNRRAVSWYERNVRGGEGDCGRSEAIRAQVVIMALALSEIEAEEDVYGEIGADWYELIDTLAGAIFAPLAPRLTAEQAHAMCQDAIGGGR